MGLRSRISRQAAVALSVCSALALAACGSNSSGGATSKAPGASPVSGKGHASVLDARLAATKAALPAAKVAVGGGTTIRFAAGEPLRVAFFGFGRGFDYAAPEYTAASDMARALGIKVDAFDPAGDPAKEVAQIQDATASGKYDAVVVYPLAADLDCTLLTRRLPAAGILVAVVGQPACTTQRTPAGILTTIPDTGTAETFAAWAGEIAALEHGHGKAIVLTGPKLDYVSQLATSALDAMLAQHPGIERLATLQTDYTQPDALSKMQDALQQHPDVTTVISMFPEGTQAALTALRVAGRRDVHVYDFGASKAGIALLRSGAVAMSVPYYPYTKVKTAFEALAIARRGGSVPRYIPYAGHAVEAIRRAGDPILFVTRANVGPFASTYAEY